VRRSGEIFQLFRKNQSGSRDLLFLASQKLILASRRGYFPDVNRLTQSVFRFLRDNYTPALSINNTRGSEKRQTEEKEERRLKIEIYPLTSMNSENYFSNQGANTLRSSSLSRKFRNQARSNFQVDAV